MNIYKKFELESTFVEIINPKKSNIIVGTIYRHPEMDVTEFNNILNNILKKINQEQKNSVSFRQFQYWLDAFGMLALGHVDHARTHGTNVTRFSKLSGNTAIPESSVSHN